MEEFSHLRLLIDGASILGVQLPHDILPRFSSYIETLQLWSRTINLVSQPDTETLVRKHLLDSLAIAPLIPPATSLLDLGSGAGFPGLPLAILTPALRVALIEGRRKRANFLKEAARRSLCTNVEIYEGRAEDWAKKSHLTSSFDIVITRATWSVATFLRLAEPFLAPEGRAIAMKGPQGEQELLNLTDFSPLILQRRYHYSLPFGYEQHQAVIFAK